MKINGDTVGKDPLVLYFQDVSHVQKKGRNGTVQDLTREEEIGLAERIQGADREDAQQARKELIEKNLRLVISIAKKFNHITGIDFGDLIQEGNKGLVTASGKYDLSFNTKFSTYATIWIHNEILRFIKDKHRIIRIPAYLQEAITKLNRIEKELRDEFERKPTQEELREALGVKSKRFKAILHARALMRSMQSTLDGLHDGGGPDLEDIILDKDEKLTASTSAELSLPDAISKLNPIQQTVIKGYFMEEETLENIGEKLSLTKERVRQLKNKALEDLRTLMCNS